MQSEKEITYILLAIWFGITAMVYLIILYYQKTRANIHKIEKEKQLIAFKASVSAEEQQKEKIAIHLHDEVLPILTSLKQNTFQHQNDLLTGELNTKELEKDAELIDASIKVIRNVALDLMPTIFLRFGLIKSLEEYIRQLNNKSVIVEFENKLTLTELSLTKTEQITVYRICLELLGNLQKHSNYKYLGVTIINNDSQLSFVFRHDGKGITNEEIETLTANSTGLGLNLLKTRLLILNANVNYAIETNVSKITLTIPFKK